MKLWSKTFLTSAYVFRIGTNNAFNIDVILRESYDVDIDPGQRTVEVEKGNLKWSKSIHNALHWTATKTQLILTMFVLIMK